jgi:TM2 domain-containing membrane protein YozV
MKRINLLLCLLCLSIFSIKAQQVYEDLVFLKNGSIIRGIIIEQIPNQSLKIQTKDGSVYTYNIADVEKMTKEEVYYNRRYRHDNYNQYNETNPNYKSPTAAVLFSVLMPGGGQFYNGQTGKGVLMLGVSVASWCVAAAGISSMDYEGNGASFLVYLVGLAGVAGTSIWSIADASNTARALNFKNGLSLNYRINKNTDLVLRPDYKLDDYSSKPSPIFGAKLSIHLH